MENILARMPSLTLSKFYQFDETTLFMINLILVFMLLADPAMRIDLIDFILANEKVEGALLLLVCTYAFFLVFRMVLSPEKNDDYKGIVGLYVIIVNLFIGYSAMDYLNSTDSGILDYAFPAFNLLLAFVALFAFRAGTGKPEEIITNKQARGAELIVGIIAVPLLVFVIVAPTYNHWTIAFSACLFYAIFINRIATGLLFGKRIAVPEGK